MLLGCGLRCCGFGGFGGGGMCWVLWWCCVVLWIGLVFGYGVLFPCLVVGVDAVGEGFGFFGEEELQRGFDLGFDLVGALGDELDEFGEVGEL